jgi:hypothetical protein
MTPELREQAGALALAVEHGLTEKREAIDWACELVAREASPSPELLELAGAVRPNAPDVARMLRAIAARPDPDLVFRKFLARVRDAVRARADIWRVVTHVLEELAIQGQVPAPLAGRCFGFDDERSLADEGVYGTVDAVEADVRAFLETESEPSELTSLLAWAKRFVDDAQPGWVECELTDAEGRVHLFREKVPVVTSENLDASSTYPRPVTLACQIRGQRTSSGYAVVEVDTSQPSGIESTEGRTSFVVSPQLLVTAERAPSSSGLRQTPPSRSLGRRS